MGEVGLKDVGNIKLNWVDPFFNLIKKCKFKSKLKVKWISQNSFMLTGLGLELKGHYENYQLGSGCSWSNSKNELDPSSTHLLIRQETSIFKKKKRKENKGILSNHTVNYEVGFYNSPFFFKEVFIVVTQQVWVYSVHVAEWVLGRVFFPSIQPSNQVHSSRGSNHTNSITNIAKVRYVLEVSNPSFTLIFYSTKRIVELIVMN